MSTNQTLVPAAVTLTDTASPVLLDVHELRVTFATQDGAVTAVNDLNFTLRTGETLCIVGESGCGKSTFARALIGLVKATSGRIAWLEKELQDMNTVQCLATRNDIQMIFQDPLASLNPRMTISDIIAKPLHTYSQKMPRQEVKEKVRDMMMRVGLLLNLINRYPHDFPGGKCQRIGITLALILEPKLMICDELMSALDVPIQAQVVNLLQKLQREMGLSLIFIAPDLEVVKHISDRVLVMYLGHSVELGNYDQEYHTIYSIPIRARSCRRCRYRIRIKSVIRSCIYWRGICTR